MKLSACVIAGNCKESLENMFHSIRDVVDEICVIVNKNDDGTLELCNEVADKVIFDESFIKDGEIENFSVIRNASFEMPTGDMILWIDSDDTLVNPEEFRKSIERLYEAGINAVYMDYDYEFDENGNCTTQHKRERVVCPGFFEWKEPLHEVLIPKRRANVYHLPREVSYIEHDNVQGSDNTARSIRNLRILENQEKLDTRMTMYLGNALMDVGRIDEAIVAWGKYLEESKWDQERYQVWMRIFSAYKVLGKYETAKEAACSAMIEMPEINWSYLGLSEIATIEERWKDAIHYIKLFKEGKELGKEMVHNPHGMMVTPIQILMFAYTKTGDFKRAQGCAAQLIKLEPSKKDYYMKMGVDLQNQINDMNLIRSFSEVVDATPEENRHILWNSVPPSIRDYPEFAKHIPKERDESKKTVAIFCGHDDTRPWGPEDIEKGIGGSEEAVINVSREFRKNGWNVEVYANVSKEGCIDGVNWYQTAAANTRDLVDLCILWRHPHHLYSAPNAHVTWLWLHDLQDNMEPYYDEDTMARIDKVLFLSDFHRKTAPWIEEDKVFLTTNGVDTQLMLSGDNHPETVIYASSPDRGLDTLLEMWPNVIERVPEARLNIYYGFNEWFDVRYKDDPKMLKWRADAEQYMEEEESINYYGRVGQKELANAFADAAVWAYPTDFGEISCITAMKAQCGGAIPVCTAYGALSETVRHGQMIGETDNNDVDKDVFQFELIEMLKSPGRQKRIRTEMMADARCEFGWKMVVDDWCRKFQECRTGKIKRVNA